MEMKVGLMIVGLMMLFMFMFGFLFGWVVS